MSKPDWNAEKTASDFSSNKKATGRRCPDSSGLLLKGEYFPCDTMNQMHESCVSHDGWPHGSREAEAVWR